LDSRKKKDITVWTATGRVHVRAMLFWGNSVYIGI
jgi:hypothetical protein